MVERSDCTVTPCDSFGEKRWWVVWQEQRAPLHPHWSLRVVLLVRCEMLLAPYRAWAHHWRAQGDHCERVVGMVSKPRRSVALPAL